LTITRQPASLADLPLEGRRTVVLDLVHAGVDPPARGVGVTPLAADHDVPGLRVHGQPAGQELLGPAVRPGHVDIAHPGRVRVGEQLIDPRAQGLDRTVGRQVGVPPEVDVPGPAHRGQAEPDPRSPGQPIEQRHAPTIRLAWWLMSARAVYPGTFDPLTAGHRDVVDRVRRLFDEVVVLVAVNGGKRPSEAAPERAALIRAALPPEWDNVVVAAWAGLTADFCRTHGATVLVRGVRSQADVRDEYPLSVMNEALGVTTLLVPARPELVRVSSTAVRRWSGS
jgi:pantetheine-phosphate adenylyltransferase